MIKPKTREEIESVSLSELVLQVNSGEVEEIVVKENSLEIILKNGEKVNLPGEKKEN